VWPAALRQITPQYGLGSGRPALSRAIIQEEVGGELTGGKSYDPGWVVWIAWAWVRRCERGAGVSCSLAKQAVASIVRWNTGRFMGT
jgi:hypothetical protein